MTSGPPGDGAPPAPEGAADAPREPDLGRRLRYHPTRGLPVAARAEGLYIWDQDGKRYLDGSSGAFAVNVGHGHPRVLERIRAQLDRVAFTYRTQFEAEPSNALAALLAELSPAGLDQIFFVNSGSEAVEACVKMARQYWWSSGRPGKHLVLSRRPSYHGATRGA